MKEGSAAFPGVVLGPISWSQDSLTVYLPVIAFDPPQSESEYRSELVRVDLARATDIGQLEFPENAPDESVFHSRRGDASAQNATFLTDLPTFHPEQYTNPNNFPPTNSPFDQPHLYAVGPDEKFIALEMNKNPVIRDLTDGKETVLWQRPFHPEEKGQQYHTERLRKIVWTADDKLTFETSQKAPAPGIGDVRLSDRRQAAQQLVHAFGFSVKADGRKMAYNLDYFGSYYLPEEEPYPAGFGPSGHRYDGLAVYDLISRREAKLSGKNKPTGSLWPWFW